MGLRPVLFVGLGGTGGKVLGVIRHHLARELRNVGVNAIPAGWQFLHLDVPAERDAEEEGLPFTLPKDAYVPLTNSGDTYTAAYTGMSGTLRPQGPEDADARHVAWSSWAPSPPAQVPVQLDKGAGQMRAVGRVAALAAIPRIADSIHRADTQLRRADNGLVTAGAALSVANPETIDPDPVVFVVASMNGGAGSGMLLDICDLLRVSGLANPVALMFTPDVMAGTPAQGDPGLAPNAYLLVNELLAGQWTVRAEDKSPSRARIHQAMHAIVGGAKGGPESLVFVGRRNANLSLDSGPAVYDALGRMLAELTTDATFLTSFVNFVLVNNKAPQTDLLGLQIGQNQGNGHARGLGIGFSRLTIGREFFADYARYRLLRACAEQLLEAHLHTGQGTTALQPDQLLQDAADRARLTFLTDLKLREYGQDAVTLAPYDDLLDAVSTLKTEQGRNRVEEVMSAAQAAVKAQAKSGLWGGATIATTDAGSAAAQRVEDATQPSISAEAPTANLLMEAGAQAMRRAWELRDELSRRMATVVPDSAATRGIPVTQRLLADVAKHLTDAAKELCDQADLRRREARVGLAALRAGEGFPRKSFSATDEAAVSHIAELAGEAFSGMVRAHEMELTARIAEQIVSGLVQPWDEALRVGLARLVQQVRPDKAAQKPIDMWPGAEGVPGSYRPTRIDHVLDDVDTFPRVLEDLVVGRLVTGTVSELDRPRVRRESVEWAVQQILKGEKIQQGTDRVPVARYLRAWVPDLGGTETPAAAAVSVLFTQEELTDRIEKWLMYPQSPTRAHIEMKLRDYLTCADRPHDEAEKQRRAQALVAQFGAWLRAMAPLLRFSRDLMPRIHARQQPKVMPIIGSVDVPAQLADLRADLSGILRQEFPAAGSLVFDGPPRQDAAAFSFTQEWFHPLVCADVMEPIAQTTNPEWLYRRARPLSETVPLTPEARRALVAGWFAGRMLGSAELTGRGDRCRARVRTATGWQTLDLGGVRPSRPAVEYDVPGRVVEGLMLAFIEAYRSGSIVPVEPYQHLISLGGDVLANAGDVVEWVEEGGALPESADRYRLAGGKTLDERRAALLEAVDGIEASVRHGLSLARRESEDAYSQWWASREILTDIRSALDAFRTLEFEEAPGA